MHLPIRRTSPRKLGFTLIELMVVIVLIAIMTAVILPEMKGTYEDALLRSTARKLVDVFNVANSHAIALNQIHRVRLDRRNGRYFIETRNAERGTRNSEVPGGEGTFDTRISVEIRNVAEDSADPVENAATVAADEFRNRATDGAISFYADGTADAQEILLRDRQGFRLVLRINPITARVHIIELEREP
jgi:type II secretion system protein H